VNHRCTPQLNSGALGRRHSCQGRLFEKLPASCYSTRITPPYSSDTKTAGPGGHRRTGQLRAVQCRPAKAIVRLPGVS
jgi:hypothetical protein